MVLANYDLQSRDETTERFETTYVVVFGLCKSYVMLVKRILWIATRAETFTRSYVCFQR